MQPLTEENIDIEIRLLLSAIFEKYGYDFSDYSKEHIKRRILNRLNVSGLQNISEMQNQVLHDKDFANRMLEDLSITVTEMFRDPLTYKVIREKIVPLLKTYPFIRIWHAGCATGEEVYSMAILLKEEGLLDRTTIYATDFNQKALNTAKNGIYSHKSIKAYTANYQQAGGYEEFSNYYSSDNEVVIMNQELKKNIVWANHNLVTDSVFSSVHMVFCRNVMIYFNNHLQNKVHQLFFDSLVEGGFLCLGSKESIKYTKFIGKYHEIDQVHNLFKKNY